MSLPAASAVLAGAGLAGAVLAADGALLSAVGAGACEHALKPAAPASRAQQARVMGLVRSRCMSEFLARRMETGMWKRGSFANAAVLGSAHVAQLPIRPDQDEQPVPQDRVRQAGDHLHVGVQVVLFGGDGVVGIGLARLPALEQHGLPQRLLQGLGECLRRRAVKRQVGVGTARGGEVGDGEVITLGLAQVGAPETGRWRGESAADNAAIVVKVPSVPLVTPRYAVPQTSLRVRRLRSRRFLGARAGEGRAGAA